MQVKVREHTRTLNRAKAPVGDEITMDDLDAAMLPFDVRKLTLEQVRTMLRIIRNTLQGELV